MSDLLYTNDTQTIVAKKFSLKHSFRAGAIVWVKDKKRGKDMIVVFKSFSRPNRGIQLPGGRVEKLENVAEAVIREVKEEVGLETKILCPLGLVYLDNPTKSYSRVEIYYIVRPVKTFNIYQKWRHTDRDKSRQSLECWCSQIEDVIDNLVPGQVFAVNLFKQWLEEHKNKKPVATQHPRFQTYKRDVVNSRITTREVLQTDLK
jgi:8-oxo-dGTP pyrophosphatase MutT (NUDIX family)